MVSFLVDSMVVADAVAAVVVSIISGVVLSGASTHNLL